MPLLNEKGVADCAFLLRNGVKCKKVYDSGVLGFLQYNISLVYSTF
jgi:hypothetical protein